MRTFTVPLALGLCLLASHAHAQRPGARTVTAVFTMPTGRDPHTVTIDTDNDFFKSTDDGSVIDGELLVESSQGGGDGLELHGRIPTIGSPSDTPVRQIIFFFDYAGMVNLVSNTNPLFPGAPWNAEDDGSGIHHALRFYKSDAGAELNLGAAYATFNVQLDDASDPGGFKQVGNVYGLATTTIFAVPEPGTVGLLVGLGVSSLGLAARRRRRK